MRKKNEDERRTKKSGGASVTNMLHGVGRKERREKETKEEEIEEQGEHACSNYFLMSGRSLLTQRRRQDLPVRGRKPLDRMELQSRGPCTRTCSSSTASSSAVQCPFRTASPPPAAASLLPLPLPPPRLRAPPGARAIASTLSDLAGQAVEYKCRRALVSLWGGGGGERVAHVALCGRVRLRSDGRV